MKPRYKEAKLFKKRVSRPDAKFPGSSETILKTTYRLPAKFEVAMIWGGGGLRYEWTPDIPNRHTATKRFWKAYTAAQIDFLADVAAIEGSAIAFLGGPYRQPSITEAPTKH